MNINVDKLKLIIKNCTSFSDLCKKMNINNNGYSFKKLHAIINENKISVVHFKYGSNDKYDLELLKRLVKNSTTYSEICRGFKIKETGGNIKTIKRRIEENNIDIFHFNGKGWNQGKRHINTFEARPLKNILIENSTYINTHKLKLRLVKEGLLEDKCYGENCTITNTWNNKKISLQLDHINGKRRDNRIKNLRLLCPNCHSQTETYAGKNNKFYMVIVEELVDS